MTIVELRRRRAEVIDRMTALNDGAETESRAFTADEQTEYDALDTELDDLNARHERAQRLEEERTRSLATGPRAGRPDTGPRAAEPQADEFMVSRCIRALAAGGNAERALDFADRNWGPDDAATRALSASDAASGGVFIVGDRASEIIELLRPASVVESLNPVFAEMASGIFDMPKITGGASASYGDEGDDIPASEQTAGNERLIAKPLRALVPVSNMLLRRQSSVNDRLIQDDMVASLAQRGDLAFIRGPGTAAQPKGLRYWAPAANVIPANATVNLVNVTNDLAKLFLALEGANVRMLRPGILMSPRTKYFLMNLRDGNGNYVYRDEMAEGKLNDAPFRSTSQIPNNLGAGNESELYLADFADIVVGKTAGLLLSASDQAAYKDASGTLVSAFSKDQTVIRTIIEHDLGTRHDESVAVLTAVTWGA